MFWFSGYRPFSMPAVLISGGVVSASPVCVHNLIWGRPGAVISPLPYRITLCTPGPHTHRTHTPAPRTAPRRPVARVTGENTSIKWRRTSHRLGTRDAAPTADTTMKIDWDKVDYPELVLSRFPSRRSVVFGTKGVVSASQPLAVEAGLEILRKGGNAGTSMNLCPS